MIEGVALVPLLYAALPILTILVGAILIYWLYTRAWDRRGARWFVAVLLVAHGWMALNAVHMVLTDPALLRGVIVLETTVGFAMFMTWVVFVSVYTDLGFHRSRLVQGWMVAFVGGYLVLAVTNPAHRLLYDGLPVRTEPLTYVGPEVAPGFLTLAVFGLVLVGYSLYVLLVHLVTTQRRSDLQIVLMLVGVVSIAMAEAIGQLDLLPAPGLHHAAYGVLPFQVLATLTLFRLHLFDVQPVARNAVVEALDDPIVLLDEDRRLVDYNDAAVDRWPTISERVGDPLATAVPELAEAIDLPTSASEASGQAVLGDGGRARHYSVTASPIARRDGDAAGWHAILLRDVTDMERSRRELGRQNERLDQVASTISHDLRNPIQVAAGHADLLEDDLRSLADAADGPADEVEATLDEGHTYLAETERSLDRMEEIIDDVLTLAREGRAVEDPEPVSLAAVARDAWDTVETGEATLEVAVDPDWTVEADRGRLRSILENLFRNAIEHGGPSVTVTVEPTETGFAVADDGPGIPADAVDDVFDYGYSTDDDGTGFGLAIVRTMADSHGWTVSVDRTYDEGARFVFDVGGGVGTGTVGGPGHEAVDGAGGAESGGESHAEIGGVDADGGDDD